MTKSTITIFQHKDLPGFTPDISGFSFPDGHDFIIFPGFSDVHVHFREPGFSYKETIRTGTMAAAAGGYVDVCTMPNLNPVPDSLEHLKEQLDIIESDALIRIHPYGSLTVNEEGVQFSDIEGMAPYVVGFSDDGKGVQSESLMKTAMLQVKETGKLIAAHCEVNDLLNGGYIHDGQYAKDFRHKGISSESEWKMIERDIRLAEETGCPYHVCHISTKESVDLIRDAKERGVNITCETGPHYLTLDENDLEEDGKFKMNPPLRTEEDRLALIEGLKDGTIDIIATDHAPHSEEEKSKGLEASSFGIVGLETAFPVLYTYLVKTGIISLNTLIEKLVINPRRRFRLPETQDFTVFDLNESFIVDPESFRSMGKATPYEGHELYGVCYMTVCNNQTVFQK